jgi:hypothetical protein
MILVTVALGIAAPSLRGYASGSKLKDAARQVLAATSWARTQAVSEGRVYRFNLEEDGYSVTAQEGDAFVEQPSDLGRRMALPEGVQMSLTRQQGDGASYVDFFPDGRVEPARIRLSRNDGEMYVVSSSPSERFRIALPSEVQR